MKSPQFRSYPFNIQPILPTLSGQHVSVECEGTWWNAKVEDIDGSLVRVVFSVNGRREAIYRGSTRLLPLFKQMQQQKKNAESNNKHFARYKNLKYLDSPSSTVF